MNDKTVNIIFEFIVKEGKQERYEEVIKNQIAIAQTESDNRILSYFTTLFFLHGLIKC